MGTKVLSERTDGQDKRVPMTKAAVAADADKVAQTLPDIPTAARNDDVIKIAPITTFNDWVLLIPFLIETNLELPVDAEYRNVGIVIGKSNTIMAPSGQFVQSQLTYGQVVWFQKRSIVGEMRVEQDPYIGRRIVVMSERNLICSLVPVPFEIVDSPIVVASIPRDDK